MARSRAVQCRHSDELVDDVSIDLERGLTERELFGLSDLDPPARRQSATGG